MSRIDHEPFSSNVCRPPTVRGRMIDQGTDSGSRDSIVRSVFLVAPDFATRGGFELQMSLLATGLSKVGILVDVFIRQAVDGEHPYLRSMRQAGVRVHAPPVWCGRMFGIMTAWRDQARGGILTLLSPLAWTIAVLDAAIRRRAFQESFCGANGVLDRIVRRFTNSDGLTWWMVRSMDFTALRRRPDLVDVQHSMVPIGIEFGIRRGIPVVYTEYGAPDAQLPGVWDGLGPLLSQVDHIIGRAEASIVGLRDVCGLDGDTHWTIVPNAVPSPPEIGSSPAPQEGGIVVTTIGRLAPEKGVADVIRACGALVAEGLPIRLVVAGDGPLFEELERTAAEVGLKGRVMFTGDFDDVGTVLDDAHIVAHATRNDGRSVAVLEAMAWGRPVVASAVGGVSELIEDGVSGRLVPPGDVEALTGAIRELTLSESLRIHMGAAARAAFERGEFRVEATVARTLSVYKEVLDWRRAATTAAASIVIDGVDRSRPLLSILMLAHVIAPSGGIETALVDLSRSLIAAGHRVSVYACCPFDKPNQNVDNLRAAGADVRTCPRWLARVAGISEHRRNAVVYRFLDLFTPLLAVPALVDVAVRGRSFGRSLEGLRGRASGAMLSRLNLNRLYYVLLDVAVSRSRPDVVHVHGWGYGDDPPGGLAWAQSRRLPTVYTEHNSPPSLTPSVETNRTIDLADAVIACSESGARALLAESRAGRPVTVIPYGVADPTVAFATFQEPGDGTADTTTTITCLARLSKDHKGQDILLRAMASVLLAAPDTRLLMAGDGTSRAALEDLSRELALEDAVTFLGHVQRARLPFLMARSDIMVLPSRWEGLPVSIIEAMAFGKPVVASAAGGNPELVEDGVSGRIVPIGDVDSLAAALIDLVNDPAQRAAMGAAARRRFDLGRFDPATVGDATVVVYRQAASRSLIEEAAAPASSKVGGEVSR